MSAKFSFDDEVFDFLPSSKLLDLPFSFGDRTTVVGEATRFGVACCWLILLLLLLAMLLLDEFGLRS